MYTRYGHVNKVFIKVGDKVKKGDKIATNGTGNGQWLAHCHRDHPKQIPGGNYCFYNIGWTKEKTLEYFGDPNNYPKALADKYSHLGYGWLQEATYSGGKCFHPGLDENGSGSGNADYDDPIYCVAGGVVEYVYAGNEKWSGWGRIIIIKEDDNTMSKKLKEALKKVFSKDYGDNLNEKEMDDIASEITKLDQKNEELFTENNRLQNELSDSKNQVVEKVVEKIVEKPVVVGIEEYSVKDLLHALINKVIK